MCLGADPSWKWFGLESTFSFFLSPAGDRCLGRYMWVHVFPASKRCPSETPGWGERGSGCRGLAPTLELRTRLWKLPWRSSPWAALPALGLTEGGRRREQSRAAQRQLAGPWEEEEEEEAEGEPAELAEPRHQITHQ